MYGMNQTNGSAVVETFKNASHDAFARWQEHRRNGTAGTPEGLQAYEDAKLASRAYVGELVDRAVRGR
jgi:hypothetical protein